VMQAEAELNFATIKAPFDGIVDRLRHQQGSLVEEGEELTTLSDNSVMWVFFNVPEARYLEDMASSGQLMDRRNIELELADRTRFPQDCESIRREAKFNNETGNLAYRADFPNPHGLLRHGQTGNILINRRLNGAIVIPQHATFEILDKQYVYVVDKDNIVHQRQVIVEYTLDDVFVLKTAETKTDGQNKEGHGKEAHGKEEHGKEAHGKEEQGKQEYKIGLNVGERIVLEGVRQVHDGEKIEYEFRKPEDVLANQKYHAE